MAGLASAIHLTREGFDVRLFERDPELRTEGVGLNIWPNGVRVLEGVGLAERFLAEAATIDRWLAIDSDGTVTSDLDITDWQTTYGAPMTGSRRRHLNTLLATIVEDGVIELERPAVGYDQTEEGVELLLADGERVAGDVLIAADGIGSRLRTQLFGRTPEYRPDGFVRWRGVFSCADAGVSERAQADVLGDEGHFGWIPIGGGYAYWYGTVGGCSEFADVYDVWARWEKAPVKRIVDASAQDTIIGRQIAHYATHPTNWVDGRVVIVGDAAHPMYPGMAQGANQALEDGKALAAHLGTRSDINAALTAFTAERMPVANAMVDFSRLAFDFPVARTEYRTGRNMQIERYLQYEPMAV